MDDLSLNNLSLNDPSLDNLPLIVYQIIFDDLHLIDLARLKRVCKRLRALVLDYRVRELVISPWEFSPILFDYADPGEFQNSSIIRPRNLRRILPFRIRTHPTGNSMFDPLRYSCSSTIDYFSVTTILLRSPQFNVRFLKSLNYCYTNRGWYPYLTFEELNQLVHLERLEIEFESFPIHFPHHANLSLPNLKTLLLNSYRDYNFTMQVDAPRCESFHLSCTHFYGFNTPNNQAIQVYFTRPHSVKFLSLGHYHESSHLFGNLESLQIVSRGQLIGPRTFAAFPRLKTLKILEHDSADGLRQLWRLCQQRNVELVFYGIRLLNGRELNDWKFQETSGTWRMLNDPYSIHYNKNYNNLVFNRLIDNYDQLEDDLNIVKKMVFSERIAGLLQADPGRFIRKFLNLFEVSSQMHIESPRLFLRLLSSQRCLINLSILNSGMPQEHFDQLATIQTLNMLHIEDETKIDLSFASKLPFLSRLTCNHHVDLLKELKFDEHMNRKTRKLTVCVERGEISLEITKYFEDPTRTRNYTYMLARIKKPEETLGFLRSDHLRIAPTECFQRLEGLVRRYEEIKNEGKRFI